MNSELNAISLFSNCGAGDYGFRKAGFRFNVMAELLPERLEVCGLNHPEAALVPGDLRDTWQTVVNAYLEETRAPLTLLAACPPCQGMSSVRAARGSTSDPAAGSKDDRNLLVVVVAEVAKALKPLFVVVENVPDFYNRLVWHPEDKRPITAARLMVETLEKDYKPFPLIADLSLFGVPQTRKRSFLTFVRRDTEELDILLKNAWLPYPEPIKTPPPTVYDWLSKYDLPSLDSKTPEKAKVGGFGDMHFVPVVTEERYRLIASIPPNSGRSAWQNDVCPHCGAKGHSLETIRCMNCDSPLPKPVTTESDGSIRLIKGFRTSYKRMNADKPAATITTATASISCHNTLHPWENRVLSPLECALLQTFDESFQWGDSLKKYGHTNVRAMIGEAVPPLFTHKQGMVLKRLMGFKTNVPLATVNFAGYRKGMNKLFPV